MRKVLSVCAAVLALGLSACGGGGGGNSPVETPVETISSLNATTTVNRAGEYKINLTGTGNQVTIAAANTVSELSIPGLNNTVTVTATTTVKLITITGQGNTVYVPVGFVATQNITGLNNQVIQR